MGYAPVIALNRLFEQTGTSPETSTLRSQRSLRGSGGRCHPWRGAGSASAVNPYGGAIALGHPVGATGAILRLRIAKDLVAADLELGIVTMCIGGGQALAALFRRAA